MRKKLLLTSILALTSAGLASAQCGPLGCPAPQFAPSAAPAFHQVAYPAAPAVSTLPVPPKGVTGHYRFHQELRRWEFIHDAVQPSPAPKAMPRPKEHGTVVSMVVVNDFAFQSTLLLTLSYQDQGVTFPVVFKDPESKITLNGKPATRAEVAGAQAVRSLEVTLYPRADKDGAAVKADFVSE
ncbi:hypothetical protein [Fimbriiglobus ruber]|uniref:Uncharacterized protein n=1 Tax=Fimbriiglobus ruber TaxID=1908690 RepID=A0A225DAE2_9BACT|nr:hypothetical protein [Fimbriiglobus ruber]OWK34266.1 hypothetical protein FRUB_10237 [Fimbriiglobus ruber]